MQKFKDFIYFNRKEIFLIVGFIIFFISYLFLNDSSNIGVIEKDEIEKIETDNNRIIIDIKGEVINPGTYEFDKDERIIDAVKKSGGLTNNADIESINLSEKLIDEMLLIIPSKNIVNKDQIINNENGETTTKKQEIVKESTIKNDGKVSINTSNHKELMTLPGIGEKKARAIIEYREINGLFKDIKDITKVSGIGNSIYEKIKDFIKI